MRLYGINHSLKACAPLESLLDESDKSNKHKPKRIPKCLTECELTEYVTNIRVDKMEQGYLGDGAILVLHYESFAYDIVTEYHESLTDFLCELHDSDASNKKVSLKAISSLAKIGGWIGLVVGASLISFLEFIYFTIQLIRTAVKGKRQVAHGVELKRAEIQPATYNPPL